MKTRKFCGFLYFSQLNSIWLFILKNTINMLGLTFTDLLEQKEISLRFD